MHLKQPRLVVARVVLALLVAALAGLLFLLLVPGALQEWVYFFAQQTPGVAQIPVFKNVPPAPEILAPRGDLPQGAVALTGRIEPGGLGMGCGFLLRLDSGREAAVLTAHSAPAKTRGLSGRFYTPDGTPAANLLASLDRGSTFVKTHFSMDYILWSVGADTPLEKFLQPDPRREAQPGETVILYTQAGDGAGGSRAWPGVVMRVDAGATWIQLDGDFDPRGSSGCPVVSKYTGKVIGMAVAGAQGPPVVIGLHPIGSLVDKMDAAIPTGGAP